MEGGLPACRLAPASGLPAVLVGTVRAPLPGPAEWSPGGGGQVGAGCMSARDPTVLEGAVRAPLPGSAEGSPSGWCALVCANKLHT